MECDCCQTNWERETKRRKILDSSCVSSEKVYLGEGLGQRWTSMSSTSSTKTCSGVSRTAPENSPHNSDNQVATDGVQVQNNRGRSILENSFHADTENDYAYSRKDGVDQHTLQNKKNKNKCDIESTLSESSWECSDAENCEVCLYIKHVHDGLRRKSSCSSLNGLSGKAQLNVNKEKKKTLKYPMGNSLTFDGKSRQVEFHQRYGKTDHSTPSIQLSPGNDITNEESLKYSRIKKTNGKACKDTFLLKIPLPFIQKEHPIPISLHEGLTIYRNYYKKDHPIVQYMTLFDDNLDFENTTNTHTFKKDSVKILETEANAKPVLCAKKHWCHAPVNAYFSHKNKFVENEDEIDKTPTKSYTKVMAVLVKTPTRVVSFEKQKCQNFLKPTISSELKNSYLMRAHLIRKMHLNVSSDRYTPSYLCLNKTQERLCEEATRITSRVMQKYTVRKTNKAPALKKNATTPLLTSHSSLVAKMHMDTNNRFEEHIKILNECATLGKCLSEFHLSKDTKNVVLSSNSSSHASDLKGTLTRNTPYYSFSQQAKGQEMKPCSPLLETLHTYSRELSEKPILKNSFSDSHCTDKLLACNEKIRVEKNRSFDIKKNQEEQKLFLVRKVNTSTINGLKKKPVDLKKDGERKHTESHLKRWMSSSQQDQGYLEEALNKNHGSKTVYCSQVPITYYKYRFPTLCSKYQKKKPYLSVPSLKNNDNSSLLTAKLSHQDFERSRPLQSWPLLPKKTTTTALPFKNSHSDYPMNLVNPSVQYTNFHQDTQVSHIFKKVPKSKNSNKTNPFQCTHHVALTRKQKGIDAPLRKGCQENKGTFNARSQCFEVLKECNQVKRPQLRERPPMTLCTPEKTQSVTKNVLSNTPDFVKTSHATRFVYQKIPSTVVKDHVQNHDSRTPVLCKNLDDNKKEQSNLSHLSKHTLCTKKGKEERKSQVQSDWKSENTHFLAKISTERTTVPTPISERYENQCIVFPEQVCEKKENMFLFELPQFALSMETMMNPSINGYPFSPESENALNSNEKLGRISSTIKDGNHADFEFSYGKNIKPLGKVSNSWSPTEKMIKTCLPMMSKNSYVQEAKQIYSSVQSYENNAQSVGTMSYLIPPSKALTQPYFIPYYPKKKAAIPFQSEGKQKIFTSFNNDDTIFKPRPMESSLTMDRIQNMLRKANACYAKRIQPLQYESRQMSSLLNENCDKQKPKNSVSPFLNTETQLPLKLYQKSQPKQFVQHHSQFLSQFNLSKFFPHHLLARKDSLLKDNAQEPSLFEKLTFHEILESSVRP